MMNTAKMRPRERSMAESFLIAIGTDAMFAESVCGDRAEEYAELRESRGIVLARLWYVSEVLRSTPHVVLHAFRKGSPRARVRLAACIAAIAVLPVTAMIALQFRDGPPARLIADGADADNAVIVNNLDSVRLAMRAFDVAGHQLAGQGLRYAWLAGVPLAVTPSGVVTCTEDGDALVGVSLGVVTARVGVHCRRVKELRASSWIDFIEGDSARDLPYVAIGMNDHAVMELRGSARVLDMSVATLSGASIRPRGAGHTAVEVHVGDRGARMEVFVHERVRSFEGLRADQRFVAVPVHLAQGDTIHLALPEGVFWLKYVPKRAGLAPPSIDLVGNITGTASDGLRAYLSPLEEYGVYCVAGRGTSVTVAHGMFGARSLDGIIALERVEP
ncbi:MAG: hypothetical protein ABJE47_07580 [bacterium]